MEGKTATLGRQWCEARAKWGLAPGRLAHGERRLGVVEGVLGKELLKAFLEQLLFAHPLKGGTVMLQDGVDALQLLADRVIAQVVVEALEFEQGDVAQRPGRLIEIIRRCAPGRRRDRRSLGRTTRARRGRKCRVRRLGQAPGQNSG